MPALAAPLHPVPASALALLKMEGRETTATATIHHLNPGRHSHPAQPTAPNAYAIVAERWRTIGMFGNRIGGGGERGTRNR